MNTQTKVECLELVSKLKYRCIKGCASSLNFSALVQQPHSFLVLYKYYAEAILGITLHAIASIGQNNSEMGYRLGENWPLVEM
ncbi:MAG: hypothetical protein ACE5EH_06695 [Gammaproteobacteria bacterium]